MLCAAGPFPVETGGLNLHNARGISAAGSIRTTQHAPAVADVYSHACMAHASRHHQAMPLLMPSQCTEYAPKQCPCCICRFLGSQLHTAASTTAVAFPASAYLALSAGAFAPAAPQVHMLGPDGHTHVVPQQAPQPLRTDSSLAAAPTSTSNSITSGDTMHQHAHLAPHTQVNFR